MAVKKFRKSWRKEISLLSKVDDLSLSSSFITPWNVQEQAGAELGQAQPLLGLEFRQAKTAAF